MIGRIGRRDAFERFHRSSRSARAGMLRVSVIEPGADDAPIAVAFAIPRRVGTAVRRNGIRRRLRAAFRAIDDEGRLPEGWYLVTVRPSTRPGDPDWAQLRSWAEAAVSELGGREPGDG